MAFLELLTSKRKLHKAKSFSKDELKFLTYNPVTGYSKFFKSHFALKFLTEVTKEKLVSATIINGASLFVISILLLSCGNSFPKMIALSVLAGMMAFVFWACIYRYVQMLPNINLDSFHAFLMKDKGNEKYTKFLKKLNKALKGTKVEFHDTIGARIMFNDKMEGERAESFFNYFMKKSGVKNVSFAEIAEVVKSKKANKAESDD